MTRKKNMTRNKSQRQTGKQENMINWQKTGTHTRLPQHTQDFHNTMVKTEFLQKVRLRFGLLPTRQRKQTNYNNRQTGHSCSKYFLLYSFILLKKAEEEEKKLWQTLYDRWRCSGHHNYISCYLYSHAVPSHTSTFSTKDLFSSPKCRKWLHSGWSRCSNPSI